MKYILQVYTGSWNAPHEPPEGIIRKIREVSSRIPVEAAVVGWRIDPPAYRQLGDFLHASGIRMLLWLPALAGTEEAAETDEALDLYGKPLRLPAEQEGEGFSFRCPSSRRNLLAVEELYERHFSGYGFDGVFLDRIRTQSFLAGAAGVLGCGCERCRKAFLEQGVDISAVREAYGRKQDAFFDMAAWPPDGRFEAEDPLAQRFFDAKEKIVADAAAELCGYFHGRGLAVGLDLFAPFVSRFAGQNYALLTKHADFIKPMLYRRTEAPAGIGYEYALFAKHAPAARGRGGYSSGRAFLDTQLEALRDVPCGRYPGIEINYDRDLVKTDPAYIAESLAAVRDSRLEGAMLSWNIMQAPSAHLDTVYKFAP